MISKKTYKALAILRDNPNITAARFAQLYFTEEKYQYLFTAVSNQGNGACSGKKAWLCAGSLLGRLAKAGLVLRAVPRDGGAYTFFLTEKGMNAYREYSIARALQSSRLLKLIESKSGRKIRLKEVPTLKP